jgi:hypothetical protein
MSLTILLWPGIIKLFPARKGLESDIPAGDRKIDKLFYSVVEEEGGLQSLYLKSGCIVPVELFYIERGCNRRTEI